MALFAISDLHLGDGIGKNMDKFGGIWINHKEKIDLAWREYVSENDTVIIGGDVSWAMRMNEAKEDLDFLANLPGFKIIHSGNHDYWWDSTAKLNAMYDNIFFLKNDFRPYGEVAICATRGWLCPNDRKFSAHDEKIYKRELLRLEISIEKAKSAGFTQMILSFHFPPTNDKKEHSGFVEIIHKHNIKTVLYGHLHGEESFNSSLIGEHKGVNYSLVSADFLEFIPKRILNF